MAPSTYHNILLILLICLFVDWISLCGQGWLQSHGLPDSASQVLELQECAAIASDTVPHTGLTPATLGPGQGAHGLRFGLVKIMVLLCLSLEPTVTRWLHYYFCNKCFIQKSNSDL